MMPSCLLATCALFLDLGVGASIFQITQPDGFWYQEAFPHHFNTVSPAYRAGLGWRFNEQWSTTISYVRLGTVKTTSLFVADQDYDNQTHRCLAHCTTPSFLRVNDIYKGVEWSTKYSLRSSLMGAILPFVRVGGAAMFHSLNAIVNGTNNGNPQFGTIPMVLAGTGVCYRSDQTLQFCLEGTFYKGLTLTSGDHGFPVSTRAETVLATVQIPLW